MGCSLNPAVSGPTAPTAPSDEHRQRAAEPYPSRRQEGPTEAEFARWAPIRRASTCGGSSASPAPLDSTRRPWRRARLEHVIAGRRRTLDACARRTPPFPTAPRPLLLRQVSLDCRVRHRRHRGCDGAAMHALGFPLAYAEQRQPGSWRGSRALEIRRQRALASLLCPRPTAALASPRPPSRGLLPDPRASPYRW